jgi:hypothetical protein
MEKGWAGQGPPAFGASRPRVSLSLISQWPLWVGRRPQGEMALVGQFANSLAVFTMGIWWG